MQRAIIYCRVSTEEQAEDGHHSLAAQEALCRRYASEKRFEIAGVFSDPGKSATTMNRPGLKDALARCQSDHSIKVFFVQDTDRLARNTGDHLTIRAVLKKHDVRLISVSQPMLEDSAEGMMIDTIIASVNQFQSDITSRKTMKGLEEKVRNGGWPGIAPVGYKNIGTGPDKQTRLVVIDEDSGPLVQKMFRMYATGNYSVHRLNGLLYEQGLRSRSGKQLQDSKIFTMLRNPFYIGEVRWGGVVSRGLHKPLIDVGLFNATKAVLLAHGGNRVRKRKHDFLLRGFLFCGDCGSQLIGERHLPKKAAYYRCHKRGGCGPAAPVPEVETAVAASFSVFDLPKELVETTVRLLRARTDKNRRSFEHDRATLLKRKAVIDTKLRKIEVKWLDGLLDDVDFKRLREDLKKQQSGMENQLADLESQRSLDYDALAEVVAFTRDLGDSYMSVPGHLRRLLLKLAWERFEITGRQVKAGLPTKFFRCLSIIEEGPSPDTQKPVHDKRASLQKGGCHPTQLSSNQSLVRLRTEWGPQRTLNRTQKSQKVVPRNTFSSLMRLIDSDAAYVHHLLALYSQIQNGLKAWRMGASSDFLDTKSTAR